ncbi:MAG: response regulator [Pseudomonadota bacterium]
MPRILIIDDDESIRAVIRKMLERTGHEVHEAVDGREGLRIFKETTADLVITDILMPEKEGIQTIMELRKESKDLKILAISGGGAVGPFTYLSMARELGADMTLSKPFTMTELSEALRTLLA